MGVGTLRGPWVQSYVPKRPPKVRFQAALGQPEATVCDPSVFPVSEVLFEFPIQEMLYEILGSSTEEGPGLQESVSGTKLSENSDQI